MSATSQNGPLDLLLAPFRMVMRLITGFTGPWTRTNGVSWLKLIVFILILRWAFFELYSIPSGSMEPTLHGDPRFLRGDRVAVNKAHFGPRIPFTTIRIFPLGEPDRWDIVVFNNVEPNAEHPTLIKRVVGLPGEEIFIRGGQLIVNGEPLDPPEHLREILYYTQTVTPPEEMVRDYLLTLAKHMSNTDNIDESAYGAEILKDDLLALNAAVESLDIETLSVEEKNTLTQDIRPLTIQMVGERLAGEFDIPSGFKYGLVKSAQYTKIPEGHYLMLGDNSGHSGDGRAFGWVPHENLYGRAFGVAWPLGHRKDLTGFTATWWGMLLLYGLPLTFIAHEFTRAFFLLSWRVARGDQSPEFQPGDRVHVNRLTYGFRVPFTRAYKLGGRTPFQGEMVAFMQREEESRQVTVNFGRLQSSNGDEHSVEVSPADTVTVHKDQLVGRAISVWWPIARRKSLVTPPAEQATASS